MHEGLGNEVTEQSVELAIYNLLNVCNTQANVETATNRDPRIASFGQALGQALLESPNIQNAARRTAEHRPEIDGEYTFNIYLRAAQKQRLRYRIPLEDHLDPSRWREGLERYTDPDGEDYADFMYDILERDIQSTKVQRYISTAIFRELANERIGDGSIVDVGCSQNLGNKKLAVGRVLPFTFERVSVAPSGITLPKRSEDWPEDPVLSAQTNQHIQQSRNIPYGLGVDLWDVELTSNRLWVDACSFYPSGLLDLWAYTPPNYISGTPHEDEDFLVHYNNQEFFEHKLLESLHVPDEVGFYQADFTKVNPEEIIKRLPDGRRPALMTIYTVMNQLTLARQQKTLKKAKAVVDPNGLILFKDFANIHPSHKNRLKINPAGPRMVGEYRLFVVDPRNPVEEYIHIATYDSGRCRRMQYQPAIKQFITDEKLALLI